MRYKEGDKLGIECSQCGEEMIFELGFMDMFSHKTGHYTMDRPMAVCPRCEHADEDVLYTKEDEKNETRD